MSSRVNSRTHLPLPLRAGARRRLRPILCFLRTRSTSVMSEHSFHFTFSLDSSSDMIITNFLFLDGLSSLSKSESFNLRYRDWSTGVYAMLRCHIAQLWVCKLMIFTFVSSFLTTFRNLTIKIRRNWQPTGWARAWTATLFTTHWLRKSAAKEYGPRRAGNDTNYCTDAFSPWISHIRVLLNDLFLANGTVVLWLHYGVIIYCKTVVHDQLLILIIPNPVLPASIALSIGGQKMFVWVYSFSF